MYDAELYLVLEVTLEGMELMVGRFFFLYIKFNGNDLNTGQFKSPEFLDKKSTITKKKKSSWKIYKNPAKHFPSKNLLTINYI